MATLRTLTLSFAAVMLSSLSAYGQDWQPVTPSDLAFGPMVDKSADAEALFWKIQVEQSMSKTVLIHYLRIKIFTERGIESQSRVDLPFSGKDEIKDIAGRVIKPDGSVVALQPSSIFERTVAKAKKVNVQVKSIVFPAVTAGSLIEYRWTEVRSEDDPYHIPLELQRDIPVQRVEYNIKPLAGRPGPVQVQAFNTTSEFVLPRSDGYLQTAVTSVPAFHDEPAMPPTGAVSAWLLLYYLPGYSFDPARDYWQEVGRFVSEKLKSSLKVSDEIRRAAKTIVSNVASPEEKLKKLYDFCVTNIKHIDDDTPEISTEARDRLKPSKSPTETLTRKLGTGKDIDFLLLALANAAGLEARYVMLGDHERPTVDFRYPAPFLLNSYNIAVKINGEWKFFDPAIKYQPFGMLRWQEEGIPALLLDEKGLLFARTQISPAETSVLKRNGTLRLSEDGTLEGDIGLWFLGHFGAAEKELMDGLTAAEREQTIRDGVKRRISSGEITNIQVENEKDPASIMTETYHVRVPGYAQRTGRRLLLQPGYFQQGLPALFSSSTRTNDIFFKHAWTEADTITIELPPGFALEEGDQPKPVSAGTSGKHVVQIGVTEDGRTLKYSRLLSFGLDQKLTFPASEYSNVKRVFDVFHELDSHTVSLIQKPQDSGARQ